MSSTWLGMKQLMEETHTALMKLIERGNGKSSFDEEESSKGDGLLPKPRGIDYGEGNANRAGDNFPPKLQFRIYSGAEPRSWLRRCERYFRVYKITDTTKKLEMTTLHLEGEVEAWYFSFTLTKR